MVGASEVRDFYGAVMADRAVKGVFITTSDFTNRAREFGTQSGLELVNMSKLIQLLEEHGLMKYDLTSGPETNNADCSGVRITGSVSHVASLPPGVGADPVEHPFAHPAFLREKQRGVVTSAAAIRRAV